MPSSMLKDNNFQQQPQPYFKPRKMHYVDISTDHDKRDEDASKLIMEARKGLRKSNTKNLQDQEVRVILVFFSWGKTLSVEVSMEFQ